MAAHDAQHCPKKRNDVPEEEEEEEDAGEMI